MTIPKNKLFKAISFLAFSILPFNVVASPTVEGNVIQWTEEGWHQVQLQSTYESVCNGGRQCTVPAGVYIVINHGTGQRFTNVVVPNSDSSSGDQPLAPVASTGQTISYIGGDDGYYRLGVSVPDQRFQDNGDGTFDDTLTGLTWLGVRNCVPIHTWPTSIDFANNFSANSGDCAELSDNSEAGDWRMPNIRELYSLINFSVAFPAWDPQIPFTGEWLQDPTSGTYWSSTSFQGSNPNSNAYTLNSGVGLTQATGKTSRMQYILPVRDTR